MNGWIWDGSDQQVSRQVGLYGQSEMQIKLNRFMDGWICECIDQRVSAQVGRYG